MAGPATFFATVEVMTYAPEPTMWPMPRRTMSVVERQRRRAVAIRSSELTLVDLVRWVRDQREVRREQRCSGMVEIDSRMI